jgi:hypothetical protein
MAWHAPTGKPVFALPDHAARDLGCLDDRVARDQASYVGLPDLDPLRIVPAAP